MRQLREPFYVSFVGHRWAANPVAFATKELAIEAAQQMCFNALITEVHDCTESNVGKLILALARDGQDITASRK